jgi:hypothetical protein
VIIKLANTQVEKDIEYLSNLLSRDGSVSARNTIYQKLDGQRNLSEVQAFLSTKVDSHLTV